MANEITPHLTAEEYMDKGEYENELKQVIGDTKVTLEARSSDFCLHNDVLALSLGLWVPWTSATSEIVYDSCA